jgi:16S rRNA (uracil1498-N3)-methyltransferase
MQLPFFFAEINSPSEKQVILDEDTSRHVVQVLRMKEGDRINLTDGKGHIYFSEISSAHKKHSNVSVISVAAAVQPPHRSVIGISLLKNTARFEWFLEKATELGITEIVPLVCSRTEKEKFRFDRLKSILVSAMLQSQQSWLPVLHQPVSFELLFAMEEIVNADGKFIAHCVDTEKTELKDAVGTTKNRILLIGPEGDFTNEEITFAVSNKFLPVSLGTTRLRTETAGMVGAVILKQL